MDRRYFITKILSGFFIVCLSPVLTLFKADRLYARETARQAGFITTSVPRKQNHISEIEQNRVRVLKISRGKKAEIHLNEMGRIIWTEIDGRQSCYQIAESITRQYDVSFMEAASDVEAFVANLIEEGFVAIHRHCPCYAYDIAGRAAV